MMTVHDVKDSLDDFIKRQSYSAVGNVERIPVTREDLVEVALKLQEAAALITQALNRMGGR